MDNATDDRLLVSQLAQAIQVHLHKVYESLYQDILNGCKDTWFVSYPCCSHMPGIACGEAINPVISGRRSTWRDQGFTSSCSATCDTWCVDRQSLSAERIYNTETYSMPQAVFLLSVSLWLTIPASISVGTAAQRSTDPATALESADPVLDSQWRQVVLDKVRVTSDGSTSAPAPRLICWHPPVCVCVCVCVCMCACLCLCVCVCVCVCACVSDTLI